MKSKFTLLIMLLISISCLSAAQMFNVPITLTQPDGSILNCFVSGDEFNHRMHDKDGYTIIQNKENAYYVYAQLNGQKLVPSNLIFGRDKAQGLVKNISVPNQFFDRSKKSLNAVKAPSHGTLANIVVFIKFEGDADISEPFTTFNSWLNDSTNVSLKGYYKDASYNQLNVESTIFPVPNGNQVVCYEDLHPREYYKPYTAQNTIGYQDDNEGFERLHICLSSALAFVENQIPEDYLLDGDNDNVVDNVCFIAAGNAGDWADVLWPHMWQLQTDAYLHGKKVLTYNFQLENFLYYSNVSVLCHEMFHSIGAPDLYHYNGDGYSPVGPWDLMENDNAQHMGAYMKFRYGNWITDVPVISESGTYYLHPLKGNYNNIYKVYSPLSPDQYFILEYRKQLGMYEANIPGNGLLVYRINLNYMGQGNPDGIGGGINNEVLLYRQYGSVDYEANVNQANMSLETGRTAIGENLNITPFLVDNTYGGLEISNVSACGDSISFDIEISVATPNYYPPRNLKAELINGNSVMLTWDKPLNADETVTFLPFRDIQSNFLIETAVSDTFFIDEDVPQGDNGPEHKYGVKALYPGVNMSEASNLVTINVLNPNSTDENDINAPFVLKALYPNPFKTGSNLEFDVKKPETLSVEVFNIKGQLVRTLADKHLYQNGSYNLFWDGRDNNHTKLASGVYFYKIKSDSRQNIKKVLFLK